MDRKIALEEHFALEETLQDNLYKGWFPAWPEIRRNLLDLTNHRLEEMDKHGIEFSVLSLHNPAVQGVYDAKRAVELARKANDTLADAISKRPGRLGGFAALPMQDPDAAIAELKNNWASREQTLTVSRRSALPTRWFTSTTPGMRRSGHRFRTSMFPSTCTRATR